MASSSNEQITNHQDSVIEDVAPRDANDDLPAPRNDDDEVGWCKHSWID